MPALSMFVICLDCFHDCCIYGFVTLNTLNTLQLWPSQNFWHGIRCLERKQ